MRRFALLLVCVALFCVEGTSAPPVVLHTLGWTSTAMGVTTWELEQCLNKHAGCDMVPLASFDAATVTADVVDLRPNQSYCWRVRPVAPGQMFAWSNVVCV